MKALPGLHAIVAVLLLVAFVTPQHAKAQDSAAKQFLQGIYSRYMGRNADGVAWRGPDANRYFDVAMAQLIARDLQETGGEVGRIGSDPFVNAQDFDIKALRIDIAASGETKAKGVVSFTNFGQRTSVEYDLVRTAQGWRIANIAWPGIQESFRTLLERPLEAD